MAQIHPSAVIAPGARLASDCRVGAFSVVGPDVVVGSGTDIGSHVLIEGITEIGERCQIFSHVVLGAAPQIFQDRSERTRLVIRDETIIREFASVHRGSVKGRGATVLGCRNFIMAYAHIAHDCILDDDVVVASQAGLAGHVEVETRAVIGGQAGIHQFVRIGQYAMVGACSAVLQDIPPFLKAQGNRAKCYGLNAVGLRRHGISEETILRLKQAYRLLFLSHLNTSQALERIALEVPSCPEIDHLTHFIKLSARGIWSARLVMERLGIIAGGGPLPIVAARDARMQGLKVVAVAVEEAASADLADEVDAICWIGAGQLGRLISTLKREHVTDAVMLGKVPLDLLFSRVKIDLAGLLFYVKLKDRRGDTILTGVGDLLAREGITLHDCRQFLSSIVLRKGILTARAPGPAERQDISFGRELARSMAQLRIGQTVVVKRRTVLAVEAIEGTDAAIRRGGALGNGGVVVVKVGRPDQDMRFDLPVIGPDTIAALEDAGATALALDSDQTLILEREKVVATADRLGMAIVAD